MNDPQDTRYSPKNFIKGKIAELVLDQMFREAGKYTVIPFGYERTLPEIAQHIRTIKYQHVLDNVRTAPDFVLISEDKTNVYMVEVKYRKSCTEVELRDICEKIQSNWNSIWLFLATQDGFYFD